MFPRLLGIWSQRKEERGMKTKNIERLEIFTLVIIDCKGALQANICMKIGLFLVPKNKLIFSLPLRDNVPKGTELQQGKSWCIWHVPVFDSVSVTLIIKTASTWKESLINKWQSRVQAPDIYWFISSSSNPMRKAFFVPLLWTDLCASQIHILRPP